MMEKKDYTLIQASLVLLGVIILVIATIVTSADYTALSMNIALDVILIGIVLLSLFRGLGRWTGKTSGVVLLALSIGFIVLYILFRAEILVVTSFNVSTLDYMIMGMVMAIALYFHQTGRIALITWEETQIWRDLFFMGVAIWFVFIVTAYLSIVQGTPFTATNFLGVPFSAASSSLGNDLGGSIIKGVAGFIEGNVFFCMILGVLSSLGITRLFPDRNAWTRLGLVFIMAIIFGLVIAFFHTGLHDPSQRATLGYIAIYFIAGATYTLFTLTSFSFIMAQGILDFEKSMLTGGAASQTLGWIILIIVSIIAGFAFFKWRGKL